MFQYFLVGNGINLARWCSPCGAASWTYQGGVVWSVAWLLALLVPFFKRKIDFKPFSSRNESSVLLLSLLNSRRPVAERCHSQPSKDVRYPTDDKSHWHCNMVVTARLFYFDICSINVGRLLGRWRNRLPWFSHDAHLNTFCYSFSFFFFVRGNPLWCQLVDCREMALK